MARNTLFPPYKLILHIITHKGNMSFRNHCTFACHCHFTRHNHKHLLLSTIHKAYFPTVYISRPSDLLALHDCFILFVWRTYTVTLNSAKYISLKRVNFTLRQDTMKSMQQVVWCLVFFWRAVLNNKSTALRTESVAGAPVMKSHGKH